jgi:hypothetical protein
MSPVLNVISIKNMAIFSRNPNVVGVWPVLLLAGYLLFTRFACEL